MLRATWILFASHLGRVARSRRALICGLLVLVPVGAALLIARAVADDVDPPSAVHVLWVLQVQLVVPLVALLLGSAVVAEEVEDRTITYLLTRPIPRPAILFGRWLASLVVLSVLLAASSWVVIDLISGAAAGSPEHALAPETARRLLATILLGGATYSLVFAAAGALLKHPVIVGLGYTFAIEGFLANLPGSGQSLTIQYYLRSFLAGDDPALVERMDELAATALVSPGEALARLATILAAAALVGAVTVARKQYVVAS